jgi:MerR family transcriptional regulator, thiopeptide resistance regulator
MKDTINLTVRQLATLANVTPRTLHYYDEIGLLEPDTIEDNGYRRYGKQAVLRLQQILFYREMDIPLETIRDLVTRPEFDAVRALQAHRASLQERSKRLEQLINTIDKTIEHLEGKREMNNDEYFEGWTEEKQPEFEKEIRQKYGEHAMDNVIDWNSYTKEQKSAIMAEGESNMQSMAFLMYLPPNSPEVQEAVARWHQHMKYFYDPSIERMRGLGQMYVDDPRFNVLYEKVRKGMALFMKQAIDVYCDRLEGKL